MPYDPSLPVNNTKVRASELRGQFNGLKDLIDTVSGVTSVVVDSVTTLPAGSQATVNLNLVGTVLHFNFGLPEGMQGEQGQAGQNGQDGAQGPPFANAVVDAVNTLNPGEPATVDVTFDGATVHFTLGIPQGAVGATGDQGPGGEISQVDLSNAITDALTQTSNNTNGVGTLSQSADSSYNQTQMQDMLNKMDELIQALRR